MAGFSTSFSISSALTIRGEAMCARCVTEVSAAVKASGAVMSGMRIIWRVLNEMAVGKAVQSLDAERGSARWCGLWEEWGGGAGSDMAVSSCN